MRKVGPIQFWISKKIVFCGEALNFPVFLLLLFLFRLPLPSPLLQLEAAPVPTSSPSTSSPTINIESLTAARLGGWWGVDGCSPFFLLNALKLFAYMKKVPKYI